MAATTSSSPNVPVDDRDYANPGVFVTGWPNVLMVEDMSLLAHVGQLPSVEVPWESLATLKVHAPELSRDIVVCGWEGVADILRVLEGRVLRDVRLRARK